MRQTKQLLQSDHLLANHAIVQNDLGHGGQSHAIYSINDAWRQHHVARKETDPISGQQEARILNTLDHPARPQCFDLLLCASQNQSILVLEYLPRPTLHNDSQKQALSLLDILTISKAFITQMSTKGFHNRVSPGSNPHASHCCDLFYSQVPPA